MTEAELAKFINQDTHWFDAKGLYWILYGIARSQSKKMGPIWALEIGTRAGSSTIPLLAGLVAGHPESKLISLDNVTDVAGREQTIDVAKERVAQNGFIRNWEYYEVDSHTWHTNHSFHLIWIDGDHSYQGVKTDFYRYSLVEDGLILLHDTETHPECRPFAVELEASSDWDVVTLPFYNGLTIARKKSDRQNGRFFKYEEDGQW